MVRGELRERLEDEYRQRELLRAQSFRQQQSELRDLEQRAKKKLMEMQHREQAMALYHVLTLFGMYSKPLRPAMNGYHMWWAPS